MTYWKNNKSVRQLSAGRFFTLSFVLLFAGCKEKLPMQIVGEAQGTYYSIQYFDSENRNLQPQIDSLLNKFDQTASLWVDSSLLRRVNNGSTDIINPLFADLLQKSLDINKYSNGAFDCRIGKIVQTWGFSFKKREEPDRTELIQLLASARGEVLIDSIGGLRIVRQYPETEIDFNAIAQGYSVDLLAKMLENYGIESYLIDVGGEVIAKGTKADGSAWKVGIEKPSKNQYDQPEVHTAIMLNNCSVVTSGSYRKYYERNGVKYSHTIDPSTGRPVEHSLLSVSVIEEESWLADAMATAYMVMGLEKSKAFIANHPDGPGTKSVFFIYDDHGTLKTYATPEFEKLEIKQ